MGRIAKTLAAVCLFAAPVALGACGEEEIGKPGHEPAREGLAIELAGVDYNVFITRQLNTSIPPDDAYYEGPAPPAGQTFYGVFLQVCNNGSRPRRTAEEFHIEDSQGNRFEPLELPETNKFAYHPKVLDPEECIPESGSVAQLGPTAGSMLLFQLPLDDTENRPLELVVESPADALEARREELTFELDI
jgi:hypothetical protein